LPIFERSIASTRRWQIRTLARHALLALAIASGIVLSADSTSAQTRVAVLEWDANTDALTAGYQVLVGTVPGNPSATYDVGAATRASVPLSLGARYYVAVRGYAANGAAGPVSVEATVDLTGVPGRPSRLSALVSGSLTDVSWGPPLSGAEPISYLVSAGTFPGGANLVNALAVGAANNVGGQLPPGVYYARVQAVNLVGVGPASDDVMFRVGGGSAPGIPSGLSVSWSGTRALLSWTPPVGAPPTSYIIEAGTAPGLSDAAAVNVGSGTSFAVDLPAGGYFVRIRAVNANGVSAPSNEVLVQRAAIPAPGAVPAIDAAVVAGTLMIDWEAPVSGGPVEGYVLEAGSAPGLSNLATLVLDGSRVFSAAIPPGTYYVRVRARNGGGLGAPSRELTIRR
jgi:predicted phage tail protein